MCIQLFLVPGVTAGCDGRHVVPILGEILSVTTKAGRKEGKNFVCFVPSWLYFMGNKD